MKKYLTTIITVAILVVAVVTLIIVMNVVNKDNGEPTATAAPVTVRKVFDVDSSTIQKIESNYKESYVLEKNTTDSGYAWSCTNKEDLKVYSSSVDNVASYLISVSGTIIADVDDKANYGFGDLSKLYNVKVTLKNGESKTVYVGDMDSSQQYYYLYDETYPKDVLKASIYSVQYLFIEKESLVNLTVFAFTSTQEPVYFIVKQEGEKVLELTFDKSIEDDSGNVSWTWSVSHPISRDCNDSAANELLNAMKSLTLGGIAAEKVAEEDLANYGLAPAKVEYYLFIKNTDGTNALHKIRVGSKTEDGSYYYCTIDDVEEGTVDIYTISTSSIYTGVNPLDFIDTYLYLKDSDLVQKVDVEVNGEKHEMRYLYEVDGEGETITTRFFDNKECKDDDDYRVVISDNRRTPPTKEDDALNKDLDITNDVITANPYDCFNRLLAALYSNLTLNEVVLEEPEESAKGENIATVKYTETDGTVTEIKLYKRDNTTAWAYINDEYAGGYVRTTQLFGDDCVEYDYIGSLVALKNVMALVP